MGSSRPPARGDLAWSRSGGLIRTPRSAVHVARAVWSLGCANRLLSGDAMLALFLGREDGVIHELPCGAWFAVIHPIDVLRVVAAVEATLAHEAPLHLVHRVMTRGRERTLFARASVEHDDAGRALRLAGEMLELR